MMKSCFRCCALLISLIVLSSCGQGGAGGGQGEFATVTVAASAKTPRLESDVLKGNTCSGTTSSSGTYATDSVDVVLSATLYPTLSSGRRVFIDKYTVSFAPVTAGAPVLSDITGSVIGTTITPGGTATVPVAVAPDSLKVQLVRNGLQLCSLTIYEYYVTISFDCVEENTGVRKSVTASLNVAFADRM